MTTQDHIAGIFAFSLCSWMMITLFASLRIQRFIVKRYETDSELGQTKYFKDFVPFAKYLPGFLSSVIYSMHLLLFVWGWRYVSFIKAKRPQIKYYDDIKAPASVTRHFSKKEIRRVKMYAVSSLILFIHLIAYFVFLIIWPTAFGRG